MLMGIYEYCGIQRCGKTTLMVKDLVRKLLGFYQPDDVYANFRIFIDGIHCLSTERLIDEVFRIKREKLRNKVFMFDEVGQFLTARGFKDKDQTDFVGFAWQMPKRGHIMLYASNVGNSADIILRDATWITIMPKYHEGQRREDDYITSNVIYNYDCCMDKGIINTNVKQYQDLFDSFEPIE